MSQALSRIFLRDLHVEALIGVYAHEKDRRQLLVVTLEVKLEATRFQQDELRETVDYDWLAAQARALAAQHIALIETFAERLCALCLSHPLVQQVRVRVEKPEAVSHAVAGVELVRSRPFIGHNSL